MTFSQKVKEEIYSSIPLKGEKGKSFSYGLLLYSKEFSSQNISITTESLEVSKIYGRALKDITGEKILPITDISIRGNTNYKIVIDNKDVCEKILGYFSHECINENLIEIFPYSFLAGVFMVCATISDPSKGYHLEFTPPSEYLADVLFELLVKLGYPPKSADRRGHFSLYYKETTFIEDILTGVGAGMSSLELMEIKIYKDFRNKTNRQSNCDNANIDKIVDAAQNQICDISYIIENNANNLLTEPLKQIAMLRLENQEVSLRELAEMSGVSRSGVNHRLKKISQIADELRKK